MDVSCPRRDYALPYPWHWLGWASPSPTTRGSGLGGLIPQPDPPILGGLPLAHDDFRTRCALLPPPKMVGSIDRRHLVSAGNPRSSYALRAHENDTLPAHTRHTQSRTAILESNAPSRPDYRMTSRSGFAASDASVSPSLRTSLPPHSARLGSTTLMAPLLGSLRPIQPQLNRSLRLRPDSTALVTSLVVSLQPLWLKLLGSLGFGRPHRPHDVAACQPSAYTALAFR